MNPIEFLKKNTYSFQPAQYNEAMADANKMDTKEWVSKWGPVFEAHENLAVDWNNSDLSKFNKDKWTRIREAFGSDDQKNPFNKPETDLKAKWQKDFKDMSFDDFKNDVGSMSKHWDNEKLAREYEAGRVARANEVKKGGPKWWLASEYSKDRYINEPEKSIFSDEGEWFNKGDDVRDVTLGGLGLVADFLPTKWTMLGPVARGVRDYANYGTPYGKDLLDIGKERGIDAGTSVAAAFLPNFRKGKRILNTFAEDTPGVGNIFKSYELNKNVGGTLNTIKTLENLKNVENINYRDIYNIVQKMPEGPSKNKFMKTLNEFDDFGSPESVKNLANRMSRQATAEHHILVNDVGLYNDKGNLVVKPNKVSEKEINPDDIQFLMEEDKLSRNDAVSELIRQKQKERDMAIKPYKALRSEVAVVEPLGPVGKFMRDYVIPTENALEQGLAKRVTNMYEAPISDKDRKLRDWYKEHYAKDWELDFKPNEKEGDPLWEAWKEWDNERKGIK